MVTWLLKIAAVEDFLQGIGTNPEVIQWISSLDDSKLTGWYANQVRQNPQITLPELQSLQPPLPKEQPYTRSELSRTQCYENDPIFRQWCLIQWRKHRIGSVIHFQGLGMAPPVATYDYTESPVVLDNVIAHIFDWYQAEHPEIASYDLKTAREASDRWHHRMATAGDGLQYDGSQRDIHTFANGWKVVEVTSENDLQVEGNLMNHCVGSYCEDVSRGDVIILSLRDQHNEPHVTIEMDPGGGIEQIEGNSNSTPKKEYIQMLKQFWKSSGALRWLEQFNGAKFHSTAYIGTDDIMEEIKDASDGNEISAILQSITSGTDEYDLPKAPTSIDVGDLYAVTVDKFGDNDGYYPQHRDIAKSFAKLAYEADVLLVRQKPTISIADYREYSRIKDLLKHINRVRKNHLALMMGAVGDQYEINNDPELSEYHADQTSIENTRAVLLEECENTWPIALGNDVIKYIAQLKKEQGPIRRADGTEL